MRFILFAFILLLFACSSPTESEKTVEKDELIFPDSVAIDKLTNTEFSLYLGESFSKKQNYIYAASFPFCWEEVKKAFDNKIEINGKFNQLLNLQISTSHKNVLAPNEYSSDIKIEDGEILATAYFKKFLLFQYPYLNINNKKFNNKIPIQAFGFYGNHHEMVEFTSIDLYDQNKYAITIQPKDKEHKIILFYQGNRSYPDFKTAFLDYELEKKKFKAVQNSQWKKYFDSEDELIVPKISFNIYKYYKELQNSEFVAGDKLYYIIKAYQRTAFVLNEKGAIVESEAEMEATTEEAMAEELPQPKLFHFLQPFYIFLQRHDAEFPYFAMYVYDTELLQLKK